METSHLVTINHIERLLFAVCLFLGFAGYARAITFSFEDARPLYAGSRPLGMGNAFTAVADTGEAGFWNPAGLVQWQGVKFFGSTKMRDRESYAFDSKCVAYSYRDFALSWGNKIALRVESGDTPDFTYYSLARKLNPYVAMGGSVKFRRRHPCGYYQFFGHSPGYDLGVLWKLDALTSAGVLAQNMGDAKRWISVVTLGFAHRFLNQAFSKSLSERGVGDFPHGLLVSVDMAGLFGDRAALESHVGWEWTTTRWMVLRGGLSDGDPTAGLGLKLSKLRIDYAWIRNAGGNAHFLSSQVDL